MSLLFCFQSSLDFKLKEIKNLNCLQIPEIPEIETEKFDQ